MRDGPRSVERVVDLLELFARDRQPKSLSQLCVLLGTPKASLFSLVGALVKREMLTRDEAGRYQLGPAALRVAMSIAATRSFTDLTHPFLLKLARETGETALIGCLDLQSLKAVYVDKAESESSVRYTVPIGQTRDLHCSSVGKLILAYRPDVAELVFKAPRLTRHTDNTIIDKKLLASQLRTVRRAGISRTIDEATFGATGMAAPILNAGGELVAGVVVAGPTQRVRPNMAKIEQALRKAAAALSAALPATGVAQISLAIEEVARRRA